MSYKARSAYPDGRIDAVVVVCQVIADGQQIESSRIPVSLFGKSLFFRTKLPFAE
ncbi:MAG: hypothetical protein IJ088_11780 [Clostridia bacterium]|nr:hypothetical protein [Clostridia bacterium]